MPSKLAFIGGGLLEGVGKGLVLDGKAKREAALKKIEQEDAQKRALELEDVKHKNRRLLQTEDRAAQQKNALELKLVPSAPKLPTGYQSTEEGGLDTSLAVLPTRRKREGWLRQSVAPMAA